MSKAVVTDADLLTADDFLANDGQAENLAQLLANQRSDRDMEWWQATCLVDNVAPTPEAVKVWLLAFSKYEQAAAAPELNWEQVQELRRIFDTAPGGRANRQTLINSVNALLKSASTRIGE